MKKYVSILVVLAVLAGGTMVVSAALLGRSKYESAEYDVVESQGAFEIRNYPDLVVATAPMATGKDSNSAFRRLFKYISGGNQKNESIAMTTPVFTTPDAGGKGGLMSFVVPKAVATAGAPQAGDEAVKVSKRAGGKFAVYRYSGRWTTAREEAAQKELESWMKTKGLKPGGVFEKANYDPPFTPGFMRRNEVLVRLKS